MPGVRDDKPDKGIPTMYAVAMPFSSPVTQSDILFYTRASDVWNVLYEDIAAARESVVMEQYIMANDVAGERFADLFCRKAQEGVSVRIILDAIGSHTLFGSELEKRMRAAGVQLKFYNEIGLTKLFNPGKWLPRNHCKNVVIDEKIGYIGSACIEELMHNWREVHIRFTGAAVSAMSQDFDNLWRRIGTPKKFKIGQTASPAMQSDGRALSYVSFGGLWRRPNPLYKEIVSRIHAAQDHVYLVSPYFMPPYRLRRAMKKAAKRGVQVSVMLGEKSDVKIADWMARLYYPRLLRNGIRIFHFTRDVLHAKYVLIDEWATLGSTNMDYLSLLRNREANVIVHDREAAGFLLNHCREDIADSKERGVHDYRKLTFISDTLHRLKVMIGVRRA